MSLDQFHRHGHEIFQLLGSVETNALRQIAELLRDQSSQFAALRQIAELSRDQSVAIRCATTDCCTFAGLICRNSSRYDRLLHFRGTNLSRYDRLLHFRGTNLSRYDRLRNFRGTNLSQFVVLLQIAELSRDQSSQFAALRQIAELSRDQSVAIRCATTDCCTFAGLICRNSSRYDRLLHFRGTNLSRYDRLLHFRGTNLSQFVARRQISALSRDQFVAIRRATTDFCTFARPICRNSSRDDRLRHFRGTNLSQFVAVRQIAALLRDQSVALRWVTTDCFIVAGPIVALRQIEELSRDQSIAILRATTDCCTFAGPISRNSSRYDRYLHFRGTNLSQLVALRQIATLSWDQSVAIRRATTDCRPFVCRHFAPHACCMHQHTTNLWPSHLLTIPQSYILHAVLL